MPAGINRFAAFLNEVERAPRDGHMLAQARFLDGVRLDGCGRVETLRFDPGPEHGNDLKLNRLRDFQPSERALEAILEPENRAQALDAGFDDYE